MSTVAKKTIAATSVDSMRNSTNANPSAAWGWSPAAGLASLNPNPNPNPNPKAGLPQAHPLSASFLLFLHLVVTYWSNIT